MRKLLFLSGFAFMLLACGHTGHGNIASALPDGDPFIGQYLDRETRDIP